MGGRGTFDATYRVEKTIGKDVGRLTLGSFNIFGRLCSFSLAMLSRTFKVSYYGILNSCAGAKDGDGVFGSHVESHVYSLDGALTTTRSARRFVGSVMRFCGSFNMNGLNLRGTFHIKRSRGSGMRVRPVAEVTRIGLRSLMKCRVPGRGLVRGARTFMENEGTGGYLLFNSTNANGSSDVGKVLGHCCSRKLHVVRICGRRFRSLGSIVTRVGGQGCGFVVCVSSLSFRRFRVRCGCLGTIVRNNLRGGPSGVLVCTADGEERLMERGSDSGLRVVSSSSLRSSSAIRRGLSLICHFNIHVCCNTPDGGRFRAVIGTLTREGKVAVPRSRLLLRTGG